MEGPRVERRRHRVYVTRNTEYHVRDGVCVGVRDRKKDAWLRGHMAIDQKIEGGVKLATDGMTLHDGDPVVGEGISFGAIERRLVTAAVEKVDRPPKDVVASYPAKKAG